MKKLSISLLALLLSAQLGVNAQGRHNRGNGEDGGQQRQEMVQRQAEALVQRMELDATTAAWFMPLYVEYGEALGAVRRESMPNRDKKIDELSDEAAEQMVLDAFAAEEKIVEVKRAYYARFKEGLTPQQLIKVFTQQFGQRGQRGAAGGQRGGFDGQRGGFGGPGFGGPGFGGPGFGGPEF